jgi:hypothetical protein
MCGAIGVDDLAGETHVVVTVCKLQTTDIATPRGAAAPETPSAAASALSCA